MKKVIQVISYETGGVTHEVDVTGKSDNQIEKIEAGMNRNLNHDEYFTQEKEIEDRDLIRSY